MVKLLKKEKIIVDKLSIFLKISVFLGTGLTIFFFFFIIGHILF